MRNRLTSTAFGRGTLRATAVLTLAAGSIGVVGITSASAASQAATLSAASGKSGGTNTITATVPTAAFTAGNTFTEFQVAATATTKCTAGWQAASSVTATTGVVDSSGASNQRILSGTKLVITVPSGVALPVSNPPTSMTLNLCVYSSQSAPSGTTSNVLAEAKYTIAAAPTINALNAATPGIKPAAGPALGGNTVQINGTGFVGSTAQPVTATLGGSALKIVSVNTAGTLITATVPPRAAATGVSLVVNTLGGNATLNPAYDFTNGIIVSPNTTPTATAATDLDVQGAGFSTMNWTTTDGTTPDDAHAHVYLVKGAYDPTAVAKPTPETGECVNVLLISDTELICTMNTLHAFNQNVDTAIGNGAYTVTVVNDGQPDVQVGGANADANYTSTIITSGSTFTVAPY
jgi:IPT/TIG domain-containing protein